MGILVPHALMPMQIRSLSCCTIRVVYPTLWLPLTSVIALNSTTKTMNLLGTCITDGLNFRDSMDHPTRQIWSIARHAQLNGQRANLNICAWFLNWAILFVIDALYVVIHLQNYRHRRHRKDMGIDATDGLRENPDNQPMHSSCEVRRVDDGQSLVAAG